MDSTLTANHCSLFTPLPEQALEDMVRNHLDLEAVGSQPHTTGDLPSAEEAMVEAMTEATARIVDGRVELGIPWIDSSLAITSNCSQTEKQLQSLERSLDKRPAVREQYCAVLKSHLQMGYITYDNYMQ